VAVLQVCLGLSWDPTRLPLQEGGRHLECPNNIECRGVGFVSACMSHSAIATQTSHIITLLSHSTGGFYIHKAETI